MDKQSKEKKMEKIIGTSEQLKDLEICDCDCHRPGFDIKHVIPCCSICSFCKKRIKGGAESHELMCSDNPKNKIKRLK